MKNRELFTTNNEIHHHSARQTHNFHFPPSNLKKVSARSVLRGYKNIQ